MGRSITLTLKGIPPSLNEFYGRENSREYRKVKSEWTDTVMWTLKQQGVRLQKPFERAIVTIIYYFPDKRRRDADNYSGKFFMDGFVRGGVIVDDDLWHITTTVTAELGRENPRTVIVIQEV